jgi:hypothetical protein
LILWILYVFTYKSVLKLKRSGRNKNGNLG